MRPLLAVLALLVIAPGARAASGPCVIGTQSPTCNVVMGR
jgi:hypothetical protein